MTHTELTKAEKDFIFWTRLMKAVLARPIRDRTLSRVMRRRYKIPEGDWV